MLSPTVSQILQSYLKVSADTTFITMLMSVQESRFAPLIYTRGTFCAQPHSKLVGYEFHIGNPGRSVSIDPTDLLH